MDSTAFFDPADLAAAIVNSSHDAIVAKDLEGRVLSWNPAAERIFGWTADEMIGQSIRRIIPADRQVEEDFILAAIVQGERITHFETVRQRKDGSLVDISVLVSPVRDRNGTIVGASKMARDITEEVRTRRALADVERRFGLMADNIAQLAWIAQPDGSRVWFNRRWYDYTKAAPDAMRGWGWQSIHHPHHVERVIQRYRSCFAAGEEWEDSFPLRGADGTYRWFLARAVPLRNNDGAVVCWFGTNTDITEQRDAERRIEMLLMEVNHRSKNLLTVVQSLARRTAASSSGDFTKRLEQRIAGMAANQDVLVHRNWSAVPLRELIEAQLHFLEHGLHQIAMTGPDVVVQPSAAEAVSMVLHELATNAEKYGALSVPGGRVAIDWGIEGAGDEAEFTLCWSERDGPPVSPPDDTGFGSRIIEEVPRGKLSAQVDIAYAPEGFCFTLRCPPQNVLACPESE